MKNELNLINEPCKSNNVPLLKKFIAGKRGTTASGCCGPTAVGASVSGVAGRRRNDETK